MDHEEEDIAIDIAEKLRREITCAICHGQYRDPKVLPCCHYYCKQCIHGLATNDSSSIDRTFSCPECRQDTTLPQGGVDHLQVAFFINRMKELYSKLERVHGKVEAKCEQCSGGKAEAFCRQCAEFICAECVKQHHRMKAFAGHKTVTLEELKEGGAKEIISVEESSLQVCQKHMEPMKIYCFTCNCLICRDCTIKDHFAHNHDFVKNAAPETKKELVRSLDSLKEVKMSLRHAVEKTQTVRSEIEAQKESIANEIETSFEVFHKIVEERKQQFLKESKTEFARKLKNLSDQEQSMSTECVVAQSVIEYIELCVEHSTDEEIMCKHGDIQSRIDEEIEEHCREGRSLEPVEKVEVGVEVSCSEDLHQFCQTNDRSSIVVFRIPTSLVLK